jgi:hypothetical protein
MENAADLILGTPSPAISGYGFQGPAGMTAFSIPTLSQGSSNYQKPVTPCKLPGAHVRDVGQQSALAFSRRQSEILCFLFL